VTDLDPRVPADLPARRRAPWWAHLPFVVLLLLGAGIRFVVMAAYRPALLFPDSFGYLKAALQGVLNQLRPDGYSVLLAPLVRAGEWLYPRADIVHSFYAISAAQHLMGLGLAVVCYAFLVRRGVPWWGATLAMLPLLFDPLQLLLEHYILSDVLFEVLVVCACLLVLWRRRPGVLAVVLAGLLIGWAAVTRGAGSFLLPVFVVALLCLRVHWVKIVAFVVAGVIPLAGYMVAYHAQHGEYATVSTGPRFLYARLAPFVECKKVPVPAYEKSLCPARPVGARHNTDYYMWGRQRGPQYHVTPPPGKTQIQVVKDWDKRIVRAEPATYARVALTDFARGFVPSRTYEVPGYPAGRWLFHDHYWTLDEFIKLHKMKPRVLKGTSYSPAAASFMTRYGESLWTPGPLLALLLVISGVAAFGFRRSRLSGDRVAIGLLSGACLLQLLTCAALSGFSWRYQLPMLVMFPMAAALGTAALARGRAPGREIDPPLRLLDRMVEWPSRLPLPARTRSALENAALRGRLHTVVAVLVGLVAGCVVAAGAFGSGWAAASTAAILGVLTALCVVALLLVSRARTARDEPSDGGYAPRAPADAAAVRHSVSPR
jgi:hypothetical protein